MANDISNPSVHFNDVLKKAIDNPSRRNILRGGLGLGALSFLGLAGCGGGGSTVAAPAAWQGPDIKNPKPETVRLIGFTARGNYRTDVALAQRNHATHPLDK